MVRVRLAMNLAVLILAIVALSMEYSDWYAEVLAIKSFKVEAMAANIGLEEGWPTLRLEVRLSVGGGKSVNVLMLIYSVRLDGKLVRQKAQNFPGTGLAVSQEGRSLSIAIRLPKDTPLDSVETGRCMVSVQANLKTRFGVVPVEYRLIPQSRHG